MKKFKFLIGLFIVSSFLFTACDGGDDDTPGTVQKPAYTLMKEHLVNNGMDLPKILTNADGAKFVAAAPAEADLDAFLAKYYIIDIRSADAFAAGHIQGAKNIAFKDIFAHAPQANGKPILIACYSGQTACYATSLMRMYGYSNTQALKWGMSGWNEETAGSWNGKVGDEANGHSNWSYASAPAKTVFGDPVISSLYTDGEQILKKRIEMVAAEGFGAATVSGTDVLNNPSNYFINNYFSEADYAGFGHIKDAQRILPLKFEDNSINNLDPTPGAKVVTYCYTGQTSAVITAYLKVLGYDAKSLTFGMNGMYTSNPQWSKNQWGHDSKPKSLPLVQ